MRKYLTLLILFTAVAVALSGCVFNRHAPEAASDIALPEPEPEAQDMILGERAEASAVDVALYFPASDGALLIRKNGALFFTDSRYTEAAEQKLGAAFVRNSDSRCETLQAIFAEEGVKTVAVENDRLTLAEFERLKKRLETLARQLLAAQAVHRIDDNLGVVDRRIHVENHVAGNMTVVEVITTNIEHAGRRQLLDRFGNLDMVDP